MLKLTATAICLALALTGIAGCGKKSPEPKPLDQSSATDSGQPTPPPTLPPEVRQRNEAGVMATVEAFVEAWNRASSHGDTRSLEQISLPECDKCIAAVQTARETYAAGGRYENANWEIRKLTLKGIEEGIAYVELLVDVAPNTYIASAGASPKSFGGNTNYPHFIRLKWTENSGWRVFALDPRPTT